MKKLDSIYGHKTLPPASTAVVPAASSTTIFIPPGSRSSSDDAYSVLWTNLIACWMIFGTICLSNGTLVDRERTKESRIAQQKKPQTALWKCQLHPASWIGSTGYIVYGYSDFSNWQYVLTPYNVISERSRIFRACRRRDFLEVRRLLDEGLASPRDVSSRGRTPLHVSNYHYCRQQGSPAYCGVDSSLGCSARYMRLTD